MTAFRFYDNREKYLLFVTTTTEKEAIARRVGRELDKLRPQPPAIKLFDAGMGDATVLSSVLEEMHWRYPTTPHYVVGKEISMEDTRIGLSKLDARFAEHPETVVVMTNMYYREAGTLTPERPGEEIQWWDIPLEGSTAHEFASQLRNLGELVKEGWRTTQTESGNMKYARPSVIVLYRADHAFALDHLIPRNGTAVADFDLVVAAQPFRSRVDADFKVDKVLVPLAESLGPDGRMVVVQSTGADPGMEIVESLWPGEQPFRTPRRELMERVEKSGFNVDDTDSTFRYEMHALPEEVTEDASGHIGTSMLLAAWNAAVYVAQIDSERVNEALKAGSYLEATEAVLQRHGQLWFQDESFVITR